MLLFPQVLHCGDCWPSHQVFVETSSSNSNSNMGLSLRLILLYSLIWVNDLFLFGFQFTLCFGLLILFMFEVFKEIKQGLVFGYDILKVLGY